MDENPVVEHPVGRLCDWAVTSSAPLDVSVPRVQVEPHGLASRLAFENVMGYEISFPVEFQEALRRWIERSADGQATEHGGR